MTYPLIITGAGASYDCVPPGDYPVNDYDLRDWKPPLTKYLFDGTRFQNLIDKYPEMTDMVSHIRSRLRAGSLTFEEVLTTQHKDGVKNDPDLKKSFVALLFYLSDLFGSVSRNYYRPNNNYSDLFHQIKQNGGRAIFVNFNYDLLLERVLGKTNVDNPDDYISGNIPIIKIHGACNWYWARGINLLEDKPSYDLLMSVPETIIGTPNMEEWKLVIKNDKENPKSIYAKQFAPLRGYSFHPALALPIQEKNNFVCPQSHIDLLNLQIPKIDRILIIGWKVKDQFLLNLLLEELSKRNIPIAFVGGEDSKNTLEQLNAKITSNIRVIADKGFTNYMGSDEAEEFLK
ncbi:MAG: hypothetical protein AAB774_01960 [Patescibacteria group bacterium]